jgi:Ni2+-binding GTPase involved in maturation of urease and hydrogenase
VVITKGDIVSQAEREVFAFKVRQANPKCRIYSINGLTGQGTFPLLKQLSESSEVEDIENLLLRFTMPAALCSYCLGERKVGYDYQIGNTKTVNFSNREF